MRIEVRASEQITSGSNNKWRLNLAVVFDVFPTVSFNNSNWKSRWQKTRVTSVYILSCIKSR